MKFNVGMYAGTFSPLHQGHVSSIIQAANQTQELYIVLYVTSMSAELDELVRYRHLYQLTKHLSHVHLITIDEQSKKSASEHQSVRSVPEQLVKSLDVIFIDDKHDTAQQQLKLLYPKVQLYVLPEHGIKEQELRDHPFVYWDKLSDIVKPWYTKKVLIIGSESTGKSTLGMNLQHYFNAAYIEEAGRELSFKSGTPDKMLSEDFIEILLRQKINEIEALKQGKKLLLVDTDALITQFYINFFNDPQAKLNQALSDAIDGLNRFDLILFLEPDVAFVHDGERSPLIAAQRQKYSQMIKDLFMSHHKSFVSISGSYQERFEQAVKLISKLIS